MPKQHPLLKHGGFFTEDEKSWMMEQMVLPESTLYAARLAFAPRSREPHRRQDGLPAITPGHLYTPLPPDQTQMMNAYLQNTPFVNLLNQLCEYENAGPHQANELFWSTQSRRMPHISEVAPGGDASIGHFHHHDSYLREEFFNHLDRNHSQWSLPACLAWAHPEHWMHVESDTLEARFSLGDRPSYPNVARPEFLERDILQLHDIAGLWETRLVDSYGVLLETKDVRTEEEALPLAVPEQSIEGIERIRINEPPDEWQINDVVTYAYNPDTVPPQAAGHKRPASASETARKKPRRGNESAGDSEGEGTKEMEGAGGGEGEANAEGAKEGGGHLEGTGEGAESVEGAANKRGTGRGRRKKQEKGVGKGKGTARDTAISTDEIDELAESDTEVASAPLVVGTRRSARRAPLPVDAEAAAEVAAREAKTRAKPRPKAKASETSAGVSKQKGKAKGGVLSPRAVGKPRASARSTPIVKQRKGESKGSGSKFKEVITEDVEDGVSIGGADSDADSDSDTAEYSESSSPARRTSKR